MKGTTLRLTGGLVALIALTSFGQIASQTARPTPTPTGKASQPGLAKMLEQKDTMMQAQALVRIPTGLEVFEKVVDEIKAGKVPAEIYPPGYFERLIAIGDEPVYQPQSFNRYASALKAGDKSNMTWMDPTFTMGSPSSEALRFSVEVQHTVTLTSGFYIDHYPVTQGQYLDVVGNNPSHFTSANGYTDDLNRPVENVNWQNATNYCYLLTQRELSAGHIQSGWAYRLPTEAEWEYSCRAGTTTAFNFGGTIHGGDANFDTHYEYNASSGETYIPSPTISFLGRTETVGNYVANPFGLFDMHGNVWEWCQDWYDNYPSGSAIDPQGPATGTYKVLRGGAWYSQGQHCRSAMRSYQTPTLASDSYGFRTVLAPIIPEWKTAITTQPSQPIYNNCVARGSGKDNLIVVTHGWSIKIPGLPAPTDVPWIDEMTTAISQYLSAHSLNSWQVYGYEWLQNSWTIDPDDALNNARQEGKKLGQCLASQGWTHIHLIGFSAGAGLIQAATEQIKAMSPSVTIHCTFLDAFVGLDYSGLTRYGIGADWVDSYYSHGDTFTGGEHYPFTEGNYANAYNVDVTPLDPNKIIGAKFRSSTTGQMEPCVKTITSHQWPRDFYLNTITGNVNQDYAGFGFPLSKEGGNWNYAVANYTAGNNPSRLLGTPDPTCTTDIQLTPPTYVDTTVDFTQLPTIQSDTGTVQKWLDSLKLFSGSPAWLATVVSSTNPVNAVSFNTLFSSSSGAQGLLSVYWDGQKIGSIDERIGNTNHYSLRFPNAVASSEHVLGFRLDPFTNIQSVVTITNIALNQVGVSQPFSLSIVTNSSSGLVYQLTGEAGFEYQVQATTNFVDWTDVAILANTNGVVRFFDQSATNCPMRFYRANASY